MNEFSYTTWGKEAKIHEQRCLGEYPERFRVSPTKLRGKQKLVKHQRYTSKSNPTYQKGNDAVGREYYYCGAQEYQC
jgi:hypothetical protein